MKKTILIYGLILGVIVTTNMVIMANMCNTNPYFETNDLLGYGALIVIYSLIFFGVRNYRNKFSGGQLSFGRAFKTGLWIALAGSALYVIVGLLVYYVFMPGYLDQYAIHVVHNATLDGKTAEEIAQVKEQMAGLKELYKNPLFAFISTLAEVLVPGVVVALVSALILRTRSGVGAPGQA